MTHAVKPAKTRRRQLEKRALADWRSDPDTPIPEAVLRRRRELLQKADALRAKLEAAGYRFRELPEILAGLEAGRERGMSQ
jgi:hypothetical protein